VVPISAASAFWPPTFAQAKRNAAFDIPNKIPIFRYSSTDFLV
jgi:hypothetical protein